MVLPTSLVDSKSWIALPGHVQLFLLLVFPLVPELFYLRAVLLVITLLAVAVLALKTGRSGVHPTVAIWTLSLSTLSFLFVLEGFFAGAPGAGQTVAIYVIYPILYTFMMAGVRNERILFGLFHTLMISSICIAMYSVFYTLIQTGILPESKYFDLLSFNWEPLAFGLHEGYIAMQIPGFNSLPFLVPFLFAASVACLPHVRRGRPYRRLLMWVACFSALTSVLLSGRRAFYLTTLTAPFLTMLFLSFQPVNERCLSKRALLRVTGSGILALVISLVSLNAIYGVTLSSMVDRFSVGFNFSPTTEDEGATARRTQYDALLAGWMENPILGAGHGAPVFGSIRSDASPWSYELCYMALLFQTGLVGFAAYAAGICWIYWMGIRVIRSGGYLSALMVACLVGLSSVLVANATNPYLARFDGMWAIFLPLTLINLWLLRPSAWPSYAT
jgi:hypothetical protein